MTNEKFLVFFGTPDLAVYALEEMKKESVLPDLIVTAPPAPAGRGRTITEPPVKIWANEYNTQTLQPKEIDDNFIKQLIQKIGNKEAIFAVFAYGKIIPKKILRIPKFGTLNLHPSMLPKLRGPSPIRTAILKNQQENVGVSIILLDEKMDHGPIVVQKRLMIRHSDWPIKGSLLDKILARKGGKLLAKTLIKHTNGDTTLKKQNHEEATYSKLFKKKDAIIDMNNDDYKNYLKICAYDGWPGAYFSKNGKRIKITSAHMESGRLIIDRIIPEGKKEIQYKNYFSTFQNGASS